MEGTRGDWSIKGQTEQREAKWEHKEGTKSTRKTNKPQTGTGAKLNKLTLWCVSIPFYKVQEKRITRNN